jgi:hypothetical protein
MRWLWVPAFAGTTAGASTGPSMNFHPTHVGYI